MIAISNRGVWTVCRDLVRRRRPRGLSKLKNIEIYVIHLLGTGTVVLVSFRFTSCKTMACKARAGQPSENLQQSRWQPGQICAAHEKAEKKQKTGAVYGKLCIGLHPLSCPAKTPDLHFQTGKISISFALRGIGFRQSDCSAIYAKDLSPLGQELDQKERWPEGACENDEIRICQEIYADLQHLAAEDRLADISIDVHCQTLAWIVLYTYAPNPNSVHRFSSTTATDAQANAVGLSPQLTAIAGLLRFVREPRQDAAPPFEAILERTHVLCHAPISALVLAELCDTKRQLSTY